MLSNRVTEYVQPTAYRSCFVRRERTWQSGCFVIFEKGYPFALGWNGPYGPYRPVLHILVVVYQFTANFHTSIPHISFLSSHTVLLSTDHALNAWKKRGGFGNEPVRCNVPENNRIMVMMFMTMSRLIFIFIANWTLGCVWITARAKPGKFQRIVSFMPPPVEE